MARIKFFIRTSEKTEQANIRVRFYNGRLFDLTANTTKLINPDFWNNSQGIVRQRAEFKDADNFQKDLENLKNGILREFNNTPDKTKINRDWLNSAIDRFYNPEKYMQDNTTLFGFIQHFINNSETRINPKTGNPVCYKMRREYDVTFSYLKEYAKNYQEPDFIDIDLEFYQQFVDFLRKKGLAINTIGKKIQTLKIFLNAASEKGINHFQKYKSRNFTAISEETDNIYLTKAELTQFYKYDFSNNPRLEKVRDLFIVGCWTGLRFSDLKQVTPSKIKGNFIELKQEKTGKKVIIPVHNTVREILNKYNGTLPKPITNQKYNDYLKEAAKIAGLNETFIKTTSTNGLKHEKSYSKHELISSHTARRSFCTNAYKDNIPTLAIMAISGHKTEQAFLKYIKADSQEHAEKVLEAWQRSGDFIRVAN
jgi:integrase